MQGYDRVDFPTWAKALLEGKTVTYRWRLRNRDSDFTKDTLHPSLGFSLQMMREASWYIKHEE